MASKKARTILVVVILAIVLLEFAFIGILIVFNQNTIVFVDNTYVATDMPTTFVPKVKISAMKLVLRRVTYFEYLHYNNVNVIKNNTNRQYFTADLSIVSEDVEIHLDTQWESQLRGMYMCTFTLDGKGYGMRYNWRTTDYIWIDKLYNATDGEVDYSTWEEIDIRLYSISCTAY